MKYIIARILLILSIGLLGVVALAQDDDLETFTFENSEQSLMFPADWEQAVDDDGILTLTTDGIEMMVYDADSIATVLEVDDIKSAEDLLKATVDSLPISDVADLNANGIKVVELDEREVARLAFETEDMTGAVIAVPMLDESFGLVIFMMDSDDNEDLAEAVDEIIGSFNINLGSNPLSGEACNLSTADTNTVQIRVGPGFNRTVIAFLPANQGFEALGQSTDDEGNIWFRVSQEEAAPTKAVNETWVASDDVDKSGDCSAVQDAAAPPIIPIQQAPPTAVPQDTTTDPATDATTTETTTDSPSAPAVDASGAILPTAGNWLLSADIGNVRCGEASATYDSGFGTFTSPLSGGGSNGILFDGGLFAFIGNNTYETSQNVVVPGGILPARMTFTITSPTTATGSFGFVDGPCTVFVPFTINFVG